MSDSSYKQGSRIAELTTPLGKDELVLTRLDGFDAVSELFEFHVEAISEKNGKIDFDPALGKNCTIRMKTIAQGDRYFVGTLTESQSLGAVIDGFHYTLTLRPWLWMLSKRVNSQIFPNKTVPDILAEVFDQYAGDYDKGQLTKSYPKVEYTVQQSESDLDFVLRLMEANGISYYFKFADQKQTLVLADSASAYYKVPGNSRKFNNTAARHNLPEEHVYSWVRQRQFTSGKAATNDYNPIKSTSDMTADKEGSAGYEHGKLEVYTHPYHSHMDDPAQQSHGKEFAKVALTSFRAADNRFMAAGDCLSFSGGGLVSMQDLPDKADEREYLVLRATHSFAAEEFRSGQGGQSGEYRGNYEFMKSSDEFAPPIRTPKPRILGTQTAKVVGKGEIDVDKYGRILVEFHWDRKKDQSMRSRVAQVWAGSNWGGIFIPRVGMEVLVQFVDGDPDRPFVIGCVYNDKNMPPYPLPSENTTAGWKSQSTPDSKGYNEFVMIDSKGAELMRVHAQKDLDSTILNDETRQIKHDRTTTIDNNDTLDTKNEILIKAGTKITLLVGQSKIVMDTSSIEISSISITVKATGDLTTEGSAMATHKAGGPMTITGVPVKIN